MRKKLFFKPKSDILDIGQYCFYIGTFFLSTTLFISGIFYLISLFISFTQKSLNFSNKKTDKLLFLSLILLFISSTFVYFTNDWNPINNGVLEIKTWDKNIIWLNFIHWFLMFLAFAGFQRYLSSENQRINTAKCLFIGTIPIIISCFMQRIFGIYGPFEFMNGLVVFYLKPINSNYGVTGLFNNPNYTGIWLSSILPFSLLILKSNRLKFFKLVLSSLTLLSSVYIICDTYSRNSFIGIFIAASIMFGTKALILALTALVLIYLISLGFPTLSFISQPNIEFLPEKIFQRLFETNYFNKFQNPRIEIWSKAIKLILEKPLLGWGAASFPILFLIAGGISDAQHTHNLFLEIAQINGLPVAIILTIFVSLLIYQTYKTIFKKNNPKEIDKAWLASSLIIIFSHLTDVTYYEGRVSLLIWIFLSGLNCIIDSHKENNMNKKNV